MQILIQFIQGHALAAVIVFNIVASAVVALLKSLQASGVQLPGPVAAVLNILVKAIDLITANLPHPQDPAQK